ncbi:uncharacterized protein LOC115222051 isoform X2 [Octopus sinensis]|uniref:Uncharacterized protein LOC115222051 isoform X2 n=1 Tax=Octopus sinensis TaxID=2607531 RepID=A0A6P7TER9_9MOLL|nr:uncharacterized protein LOC115222051 isoform X2 [Octopus sinensis]
MGRATVKSLLLVAWALIHFKDSGVEAADGCEVRGRTYPFGQPFSFTNGCFQYSCDCNRDGSWECPLERTQNTCVQNRRDPSRRQNKSKGCKVKGRYYSLDRPFSFTDGCYKYDCVCKNDGSWDCPAAKTVNVCNENTEKESIHEIITEFGQEGCLVKNKYYELGAPFSFEDGCFLYKCQCFLDGSWNCPAATTEDICRDESKQSQKNSTFQLNIRGCSVKGQHYPLGQPFSFVDGCYKYHCDCQEDGGWECPATQTENICQQRKEEKGGKEIAWNFFSATLVRTEGLEVTNCQVEGSQYPLGQPFYYRNRCFRYSCHCELDGSWNCPARDAENMCPGRNVEEYAISRSLVVISEVKACHAKGRYYTLDRPFSFVDGCFRYNCQCNGDGSWECTSEEAEYICQGSSTTERQKPQHQFYGRSVVVSSGTKVKFCVTQGVRHTLGQPFSFSYGCFQYRCDCLINGSWECPKERAQFTCRSAHTETARKTYTWSMYIMKKENVRSCVINGAEFPLGRTFNFIENCFKFRCNCHLDGSWECPAKRTEYSCGPRREDKTRMTFSTKRLGSIGSIIVTSQYEIRYCTVNNERFNLGSRFSFTEGCFKYNCMCFRNGSWECPGSDSQYICRRDTSVSFIPVSSKRFYVIHQTDANSCFANNQRYRLGESFSFVLDCFRYNCQCFYNASWECPADKSQYVCRDERRPQPTRPPRNEGNIGSIIVVSQSEIRYCMVNNERYNLGSRFSFTEGCFKYTCMCYRNGSWECPGSDSQYICDRDTDWASIPVSSKRFYVIHQTDTDSCFANNQRYRLGESFSFVLDCFRYNCQCFHNGSWECPADRSEYVCGDRTRPQPTRPPRNEVFQQSVVLNIGQTLSSCVANGQEYPLNKPFTFTDNCYRYVCMCHSNGSWECPGERAEYSCPQTPSQEPKKMPSRNMYVVVNDDPESCYVKGRKYTLGRPFSFEYGCFEYECNCNTDGSWECLSENTKNICGKPREELPYPSTSRPKISQRSVVVKTVSSIRYCSVNGNEFPLGTDFTFTDGCFRYQCECYHNGSWQCPGDDAEYVCGDQSEKEKKKAASSINFHVIVSDEMRNCEVNGESYSLGRAFTFRIGCFEFNCFCNTDGSWECLAEGIAYICDRHGRERSHHSSKWQQVFQRSVVVRTAASIRHCSVNGKEFALGEDFTFTDGCFRYQCECYRNGSWQCPGDDAKYICGDQSEKEKKKASTRTTYIVVSDDPMACVVEGKRYVLGRPFSFERGCFEYNCDCNRDGSWECSSQKSEYICDHDGNRKQEHTTECHDCVVRGKIISSGRRFSFEDGCLEFHCHCRCDGSYYCPASQTVSKCSTCQNCTVDGMKYAGGIGFKRRIDCEAISCFCHCNGTYICYPEQTMQLPCNTDIAHTGTPKPTQSVPYTLSGTLKPIKGPDHPVVGGISQSYVSPTPPSLGTVSPPHKEANKVDLSLINETEVHHDIEVKADSSIAIQGARLVHSKNETQLKFGNGTFSIHRTISTSDNDTVLTANSDTCQICHVYSKVHRGNTQFRFIEGCYEYLCNCYCDGSWTCPDNLSVNTCKKKKLTCVVDGRSYRLNTTFIKQIDSCTEQTCNCNIDGSFHCLEDSVVDVCRQAPACRLCSVRGKIIQPKTNFQLREGCFKYKCQCNCDGGWNCPKETAVNLCKRNNKCIRCNAYGTTAAPNSNFELEKDCIRYQCRCNCDGSWNCPGETAVRICGNKCIRCNAKGTIAEPDSDFILRQDCIKYQCRCNCDGSWNCPGEKALNVCNMDERTGCYYCDVKGDRKNGNSRFELKEGCYRYQCRCNCDGSWNCPAETAVNECPAKCHQCDVRGAKHEPNTRFSLQDGCIKYDCICNCDGGWRCPTGVDTCNTDPETGCHYCDVRGEKKKGHTRFELEENCYKFQCACNCDGSWKCPAATAINICQQNKTTCINCVISGKSYQSNIAFTRDVDCYRYRCFCNCDGSWNCPAESAEFICNEPSRGNCRQCNAKGKVYAGNTEFQHEENCYRYKCTCNCDGSWNCPAENAKYICGASTGNCKQCDAKGKVYAGNTEFQHEENCYRYKCKCNCDGSWNCPAENAKYICGASTGNCKQCDAKGKVYAGNSEFQHEENCYRYKCKCNCDGSWNCPAENAKYICGASTGNCKQCDAKGKVYAGNTEFQHEENCYRYKCKCNCDGSWNCPAENAKYICGASTGNCKQCDVKGKVYAGNSEFQYEENCYRYDCKCNCDGSWNCPAENAKYICGASTGNCKQCDAKGKVYAGNSEFQHEENCYRYDCKCNCDGSWNCPAENAKYICGASTGNCKQCDAKGKVYAGNSEFQHEENCYRYDCKCNCDGSWNCPAENAKYICGASTGNCQQCDAKGKIIKGNTEFQHEENCYRYQCKCNCDGSWNCPAHNAKYICGEQRENCKQCNAKGRIYAGNTEFHHEENCYRYRCKCNCDGSWNCPAENAEYICGASTGNCQQCDAKGKIVEGNTEFQHEENCYRYKCKCNCDGSWNCPSHNAEYICGDSSIPQSDRSCATCRLGNEVHQENTAVIVNNFCYHYLCHCLCNGTWNCPNDKIINRCSSVNQYPCPGEKKKCLANRVEYSPGISFYQEDNCEKHLCTCQCNGSINCFQRTAMPNCTVNKSPQCKDCIKQGCKVNGTMYYTEHFSFIHKCVLYNCSCKNGKHTCPSKLSSKIC